MNLRALLVSIFAKTDSVNAPFLEDIPKILWSRNVSGAWILDLVCEQGGYVNLPFKGQTEKMSVDVCEHELFAGKNVLLGTSNGESVAVWRGLVVVAQKTPQM